MASEEREILKYELDLTDFEAKAARAQQLVEAIKAKRTAGGDSSELEQQLGKELEAFQKLVPSQKEAKDATEQLIASKHKLASVVSLVGGQFGGEVGQVANLIALFTTSGRLIGGVATGLAALAIGIQVFRSITEAAREATEQQLKYNEAVFAGQQIKQGVADALAAGLEKLGARSPENLLSAQEMRQRLRKSYGVEKGRATDVAVLATAAQMSVEEAAELEVLVGRGATFSSPQEARAALDKAKAGGQAGDLLTTAEAHRLDASGVAAAQAAMAPGEGGRAGLSPEQAAYQELKRAGGLPADMTFAQFKDRSAHARDTRASIAGMQKQVVTLPTSRMARGPQGGEEYNPQLLMQNQISAAETDLGSWGAILNFIQQMAGAESGAIPPNVGPLFAPSEGQGASGKAIGDFIEGIKMKPDQNHGLRPSEQFGQPAPGPGGAPPAAPQPVVNQNVYYSFGTAFFAQGDPRGRDLRTKFGINSEVDIVSPL